VGDIERSLPAVLGESLSSAGRLAWIDDPEREPTLLVIRHIKNKPPGIIRSAPPISFGTTAAGVVRNGRRFGCFHKVYTRESALLTRQRIERRCMYLSVSEHQILCQS
jgi:hypothetical protein